MIEVYIDGASAGESWSKRGWNFSSIIMVMYTGILSRLAA